MDIAALSMAMSQASVQQAASLQVMGMAKNQTEMNGQQMVQMLNSAAPAPHPTSGSMIDIKV
ncbi:YjfB family protein [Paenibacillus gallinarum]|uniref:YjfB family protein n=1 Tax=Paenibacillus gallinarum TaxID=2762232 RepID=A0ABR8T5V1_9BACL|nr:YjfB family protein [Paenibacillus gallinarum]MBD7971152.1 YjfB family protein [Paenibacillus gallinarum]